MAKKKSAYAKAGVDIEKGDRFVQMIGAAVKATHGGAVAKVPSGYAGLYRLSGDMLLAATTDGVGTKLKLAFDLDRHGTVGTDLVAMSVNDLICVGARPLMFLDYFATGKLQLKTAASVVTGIARACRESGVALVGGETAEMPGFYEPGEYDLAGFAVGVVSRRELIDGRKIRSGDQLIALSSSGLHSNGYSLARKLVKNGERGLRGKLLTPTRLYVKAFDVLRRSLKGDLRGLVHVTGSGFLNIPRVNEGFHYELDLSRKGAYRESLLFKTLRERGKLSWEEAFTTFNMGIGLVAVVPARRNAAPVIAALKRAGYPAFIAGRVGPAVKRGETPTVRVRTPDGGRVVLKY